MAHSCVHFGPVRGGPDGDRFGNVFQRMQVILGVTIAPSVVCDDGDTAAEEGGEFGNHGPNGAQHEPRGQPGGEKISSGQRR